MTIHLSTWCHPLPPDIDRCIIVVSVAGFEFYHGNCRRGRIGRMDHCGNDGNFLPYSIIFYTIHCALLFWYLNSDVDQVMRKRYYYFSLSFLRKKTLKKYINMFLACQQSNVTIKLNFYYSNVKKWRGNCQNCCRQLLRSTAIFNAIAVDWFQGNSRPVL
jgi:hypothetical protein